MEIKMKTKMKEICFILLAFVSLVFFSTCSKEEDPVTSGSDKNTWVAFLNLTSNDVIEDTVILQVSFQNYTAVTEVEYYIDGILVNTANSSNSFQYRWILQNPVVGQKYKLLAKAKDKENNLVSTDTVAVHYKWIELVTDTDAGWVPNIKRVLYKKVEQQLHFKLESYGQWADPFSITEGVSFGVFLDTDKNPNTGLTPNMNYAYNINDIGADFLLITGFEANAIYKWSSTDSTWKMHGDLSGYSALNNSGTLEFAIDLNSLEGTWDFDLVTLLISANQVSGARWDWAPNSHHCSILLAELIPVELQTKPGQNSNVSEKRLFILK